MQTKQIKEHNKKVAQVWAEDKDVKFQRRMFYFLVLPAIGYIEFHLALFLIRKLWNII